MSARVDVTSSWTARKGSTAAMFYCDVVARVGRATTALANFVVQQITNQSARTIDHTCVRIGGADGPGGARDGGSP